MRCICTYITSKAAGCWNLQPEATRQRSPDFANPGIISGRSPGSRYLVPVARALLDLGLVTPILRPPVSIPRKLAVIDPQKSCSLSTLARPTFQRCTKCLKPSPLDHPARQELYSRCCLLPSSPSLPLAHSSDFSDAYGSIASVTKVLKS